jgi:hypothetical protein
MTESLEFLFKSDNFIDQYIMKHKSFFELILIIAENVALIDF